MSLSPVRRPWLANVGLSAYLVTLAFYAAGAEGDVWQQLDGALYLLVTAGLVAFSLTRAPPFNSDQRPGVWLLCGVSSLYFLGFEQGNAPSWVIGLHLLGDACLIYLGRSFAILPARRQVRTGFVYRWVRHPVYASYMLTDIAYVFSTPSAWNLAVALVGGVGLVWRARLEEDVMQRDPQYQRYMRATPHRFVPFLY
jgi:protein-S-isoprenylcysteine O-methyltransferase Ste14